VRADEDNSDEERLERALQGLGGTGAVEGAPTEAVARILATRTSDKLEPAKREAARGAVLAGSLDRQLVRAAQHLGPFVPGAALGAYIRAVRQAAGVEIDVWAARLGVSPETLHQVEASEAGLLRLGRSDVLAILLDELEMPRSSLAHAFGAAARQAAAPLRGSGKGELSAQMQARLDRLMDELGDALIDRDRPDLVD